MGKSRRSDGCIASVVFVLRDLYASKHARLEPGAPSDQSVDDIPRLTSLSLSRILFCHLVLVAVSVGLRAALLHLYL